MRSSNSGTNQAIRYEADESCPLWVSLGVGIQGTVFALAPLVLIVAITARAGGQGESYLSWAVFASLVISGCLTALQASRFWRFGAGYILIMGTTPNFVAITVLALAAGGPPLLASLVVAGSLSYLALAIWLPLLRRIITPVVSATVLMLIAVAVLPIAFDRVQEVPPGAPAFTGPAVALATLAVIVVLALRTSGAMRRWSPLIAIGAGCAVGFALGIYDVQRVIEAPWVGITLDYTPSFDLSFGHSFWALLPVFVVVTLVGAIKNIGDNVAIQQASHRGRQVTDYRQVQSSLNTNWLGIFAAGIAGTPPTTVYSSTSVSLVNLTGVAARRVGYAIGACMILLALFPKLPALLLTSPSPAMGAYHLLAIGLLFMEGVRTLVQAGLDYHKIIVVGISFTLGAGIEQKTIFADLLGGPWGGLLDNGMLVGALSAILLTLFLDMTNPRRSRRIQVGLDLAALPEIQKFAKEQAGRLGWNEAATERLLAASEETLVSLAGESGDQQPEQLPRLVVVARPEPGMVEMEFMAVFDETNLEDRLANLDEEADGRDDSEVSLRLLRHYAASVRHQKYYGLDIVTVQVRGNR